MAPRAVERAHLASTSTRCSSACAGRLFPADRVELRRRRGGLGLLLAGAAGYPPPRSGRVEYSSPPSRAAGRPSVHRHGRAVAWPRAASTPGASRSSPPAFGFADALWLALLCLAVAGGMDAISDRGFPQRDLERDGPGPPARASGRRRDDLRSPSGPISLGWKTSRRGAPRAFVGVRASVLSGGVMCVVVDRRDRGVPPADLRAWLAL